ncbi:MAG TPA: flagellar biosynthetic protein FliO [Terriglobia bacterium]|nr:flagellar biosynthetic protein FliO [Terriglobia bacterium]
MGADAASHFRPRAEAAWGFALKRVWQLARRAVTSRRTRRLRVSETLSLGERRFLAVIEFDHQEFLVAGSGNSLQLLARVEGGRVVGDPSQPANPPGQQGWVPR